LRMLLLQPRVALADVIAEERQEGVRPHVLGLAVLAVAIDRDRIDGGAILDAIHVADVVAQVHAAVPLLAETIDQGKQETVNAVQPRPLEELVVDEAVAGAVDRPRDADRIDAGAGNPHPPRRAVEAEEQPREERDVTQHHQRGDHIPAVVGEEKTTWFDCCGIHCGKREASERAPHSGRPGAPFYDFARSATQSILKGGSGNMRHRTSGWIARQRAPNHPAPENTILATWPTFASSTPMAASMPMRSSPSRRGPRSRESICATSAPPCACGAAARTSMRRARASRRRRTRARRSRSWARAISITSPRCSSSAWKNRSRCCTSTTIQIGCDWHRAGTAVPGSTACWRCRTCNASSRSVAAATTWSIPAARAATCRRWTPAGLPCFRGSTERRTCAAASPMARGTRGATGTSIGATSRPCRCSRRSMR